MEDRASAVSPAVSKYSSSQDSTQTTTTEMIRRREGRGAWVLTAYGISGLAVFGVLAYFFSDFIAH